jgi:hypothetical protein
MKKKAVNQLKTIKFIIAKKLLTGLKSMVKNYEKTIYNLPIGFIDTYKCVGYSHSRRGYPSTT